MIARIEHASIRGHFRVSYVAVAGFGELLLYVCLAAPFAVDQRLSLFSLSMPRQAELFGTVWPYYSLLHLLAMATACALGVLSPTRTLLSNRPFGVYCAVNLVGMVALPLLNPVGHPIYWDFALEFLRITSLVLLALAVLEARDYDPMVLVRSLFLMLLIPLAMLIVTNSGGFLAERQGRVNGPGLEVTSTGHVAAIAVLLSFSLPIDKTIRTLLGIVGAVVLLLSGARTPFVLAFAIIVVHIWRRTRKAKRVALLAAVAGIMALALFLSSATEAGGGRVGSLTGDRANIETEFAVGRGVAVMTSLKLLASHPLGLVDSDWAIQEELAAMGFPSHTHSHYFQSYLRFGLFSLLFWAAMARCTFKASRLHLPVAGSLWFVLIGSALDYYGFVTKAMLVVFMLTALAEAGIRQHSEPTPEMKLGPNNLLRVTR